MFENMKIINYIIITLYTLINNIFDVLSNLFNDRETFITKEGRDILNDEEKRRKLNKAIDHYRKYGNWDLLKEINNKI